MDVEVGSNLYRNTDGMIEIEGVPQIQLALKPTTGDLLVTFALFDAGGKVTAKLIESTLMINERRAYEVNATPKSLQLTHPASGTVILQIGLKAPGVVAFHCNRVHIDIVELMKRHRLSPFQFDDIRHSRQVVRQKYGRIAERYRLSYRRIICSRSGERNRVWKWTKIETCKLN